MTAVAIALGTIGVAAVVAAWDALRRALAAQVEQARLRVEAQQRHDIGELAAQVRTLRTELGDLDKALAFGRKR